MSPQLVTILVSALGGGAAVAARFWAYLRVRRRPDGSAAAAREAAGAPDDDASSADEDAAQASLLLATMSHEIRTPLNGVLGMLQLLDATELNREQRRIIQMIVDSGQVLSQVVDDYLAFYRLESGQRLVASPGVCELEELVHQTMMLFQGLAYDKGLEFVLVGDARAPHVVRTDALRLRQALSNLELNAIKYTEDGEVTVTIEAVGGHTEIAVSDTGPGMSDEDVARLFEPYFRAESSAAGEKGSGLGLAIARHLTEVLGGQLEVDSELGVGTTFTLRFAFETLVPAPPAPPELPWRSALIVGGGPSASLALAELLERFGMQVQVVEAGGVSRAGASDLVFDFTASGAEGPRAEGGGPGAAVDTAGPVRVDVLWLSDPRAHTPSAQDHVLIQPFCRATVLHTLSELASGARRTSTVDRWRHSMAETYPLSILVAEDDVVSAQVIAGMLANLGYAPVVVTSGPAAVEAIGRQRFDVALLDVNLPGYGGVEILGHVEPHATWWIAMSASVQPELRRRCRQVGFRDFLSKPLTVGALRSALVRGAKRDSGLVAPEVARATRSDGAKARAGDSLAIRQMRELFAQSPAAYRDLLRSHVDQTDLLCADLEQILSGKGEADTARRAAHTLQAAAASFGCEKVAAHARALDVEWDALSVERRHTLVRRLLAAWRDGERAEVVREFEALASSG